MKIMKSLLTLTTFFIVTARSTAITFPANASTSNCDTEYVSVTGNLDGAKFTCINNTVLDFWYFDAISFDQKTSVVISFYLSTADAFPFLSDRDNVVPTVGLYVSFLNETTFGFEFAADQATITSNSNGSSGEYVGADFVGGKAAWSSRVIDGMTDYSVVIDAPEFGVYGSVILQGTAPAHYPCTSDILTSGASEEVAPNLGWSNIIPAAVSIVDLTILGSPVRFQGLGYHDKNWSDKPFFDSVGSWYWGHTTLGEYNLVWFDYLTPEGAEYVSSYVSQNGTVIVSSCEAGAIKVRPTGQNSTYPPTTTSGTPNGFVIDISMGDNINMTVNVEGILIETGDGEYLRGLGKSWGTMAGKELTNGIAIWDAFSLKTSTAPEAKFSSLRRKSGK